MRNILIGVSMRGQRRVALWVVLGIVCFSSGPALAQRLSDFYVPDPGPGVCVQNCGNNSNSHTPSYSPPDHNNAADARAARRVERANKLLHASNAAARSGDAREALRLAREAQAMADDYKWLKERVQQLEDHIAAHERAEDALKAGDAANRAGNTALALEHYQRLVREPTGNTEHNHKLIARLQIRLQAEKEEKEEKAQAEKEAKAQAERDRLAGERIRKNLADFIASLDTGAPAPGVLVTQSRTTGDALGSHTNAPILEFGDPNAAEAQSEQARLGFDIPGRLKGSRAVPDVSTKDIRSRPVSVGALATQIPDQAKSDPIIKQSLAWYNQLDTMKAETVRKVAALKAQQKSGSGDPALLAAQLGTLANDSRRIEKDQAKAVETIKKELINLGYNKWLEVGEEDYSKNKKEGGSKDEKKGGAEAAAVAK